MEACSSSVYTLNRLPSKKLGFDFAFSLLYNKEPNIDYFRVFGSLCFPLIPQHLRNKFDPTSSYWCLLGYSPSHKAYRCLRLKHSKIIVSRNVQLHEDIFPFRDYKLNPISTKPLPLPIRNINKELIHNSIPLHMDTSSGLMDDSPSWENQSSFVTEPSPISSNNQTIPTMKNGTSEISDQPDSHNNHEHTDSSPQNPAYVSTVPQTSV